MDLNFFGTSIIMAQAPLTSLPEPQNMARTLADIAGNKVETPLWTVVALRGLIEGEQDIEIGDAPLRTIEDYIGSLEKAHQALSAFVRQEDSHPWSTKQFVANRDYLESNYQQNRVSHASSWMLQLVNFPGRTTSGLREGENTSPIATVAWKEEPALSTSAVSTGASMVGASSSAKLFRVDYDQYSFVVSDDLKIFAIVPFIE
jgi:hypothetical protein